MSSLKYLSLFSGIGSMEKALSNLKFNYDLVGFSEIEEDAIKSYCAIHNVDVNLSLGDITKIDAITLPSDIDLITHGSPCQDYSKAGKWAGGDKDSGTRSSLMWNTVELVSKILPKYIVWENVPEVLSKRHKHNVNKYLMDLDSLGYNNYTNLLNARHYSIPQNRNRIFVISIRKDVDTGFKFPKQQPSHRSLVHYLDIEVDESCYINKDLEDKLVVGQTDEHLLIRNATKKGYAEASHGDGIDFNYPTSETRRGRVQPQRAHTLTTSNNLGVLLNGRMRRFTSNEMWRLMGFTDEDYHKAKDQGIKEAALVKQAGNSIVVNVAEAIFKELLKIN